jgi:hypothetical protein
MKIAHKHFTGAVASALAVVALPFVLPASAASDAETKGLAIVKQFTVDHNERLIAQAKLLNDEVAAYYDIVKSHGFDYDKAWKADGQKIAAIIARIKPMWLEASNQYETIEGIVAGLPSTAKYDLIIDAGNPGTEKEDVAPYDLTLPDGSVMKRPGNLFHGLMEPAIWGMEKSHTKLPVDLDGDGKVARSEVLFDANFVYGTSQALLHWAKEMLKDVKAWTPNRDDAFTSVVTMTPTVGDYFGEWKESQFITGEIGSFVAQSRLVDVQGIMGGCRKMYFDAISPAVAEADKTIDAKIRADYEELLELVEDTYAREMAGNKFKPEEADALGNQAQDIADRIVAQITQVASKLKVNLKI